MIPDRLRSHRGGIIVPALHGAGRLPLPLEVATNAG